MRAASDAFLAAVRGSHTMAVRARVCTTFQTGTDPDGTEITVMGGDAQFDAGADIRGTLTLETDGTRRWPNVLDTALAPYGNELFVERGVVLGGPVGTEWVSMGYFRINKPTQDDPPDGPIVIEAQDRMAGIIDARLLEPRQFGAAVGYGFIVSTLVEEVYPDATIEWDDGTDLENNPRAVVAEQDRYEFLADLVASVGKIMYWDHRGVLVIKDPPSSTSTPVAEINSGSNGVLVDMARTLTRDGVYNAVVATGEAAASGTTPVRGVAFDDNPASPTYYSGAFGPVPMFYSSPFLTTTAAAEEAAESLLRQLLGLPYTVDLGMVPNPALEPLDPVTVRYSTQDAPETHVLQTVTIPLAPEAAMTATTREQTVVIVGIA